MKEKQIADKLLKIVKCPDCVSWVAPHFKHLSWDIFGIFDIVIYCYDPKTHPEITWYQITTLTNISHRQVKIDFLFPNGVPANAYIAGYDEKKRRFKVIPLVSVAEPKKEPFYLEEQSGLP